MAGSICSGLACSRVLFSMGKDRSLSKRLISLINRRSISSISRSSEAEHTNSNVFESEVNVTSLALKIFLSISDEPTLYHPLDEYLIPTSVWHPISAIFAYEDTSFRCSWLKSEMQSIRDTPTEETARLDVEVDQLFESAVDICFLYSFNIKICIN